MKSILFSILFLTLCTLQAQTFEWARGFGDSDWDRGLAITADRFGNVYTVGRFNGTIDFDPGPGTTNLTSKGNNDIFIQKMDASGNLLWVKAIGDTSNQSGTSVSIDASGNVYTTGLFQGTVDFDPGVGTSIQTANGASDIFVLKLDVGGNFLWVKVFGGPGGDAGITTSVDTFGNIYTAGYFEGTADLDPGAGITNLTSLGTSDVFVHKMDASGNLLWVKSFGGTVGEFPGSISIDGLGNVYLSGDFSGTIDLDPGVGVASFTSAGFTDFYLQKLDSLGNFLWAKTFGDTDYDAGFGNCVDARGDVYTTGYFRGTVDFDPGPGTANRTAMGIASNLYVQKIDPSGNLLWVKTIGGWASAIGYAITLDTLENIYVVGSFDYTIDFDPGSDTSNLISAGASDIFVLKMDHLGNHLWSQGFGGYGHDVGHDIGIDASGNVYTTGYFTFTADFDPSPDTMNLTSAGITDIFIHKMSQCPQKQSNDIVQACGSYQWIDGNTYTSSTNTPAIYYQAANGCDSIVRLNLTIDTLRATDVVQACGPYQWIDGITYTTTTNSPSYAFTTSAGCDSIVTLDLTIVSVDNSVSRNASTLIANQIGGTYKWYDCNNGFSQIPGETNRAFTPLVNGSYAVLVGKDSCALLSDCVDVINVGIFRDELEFSWKIYPNPVKENFFLEFDEAHPAITIRMYNALGQEIHTGFHSRLKKTQLGIDGPAGFYTVVIEDKDGRRSIQKLLKR
jgi:cold shock CspA family protein